MTLRLVGARVSNLITKRTFRKIKIVSMILISPNTVSKQAAPSEKKFGLAASARERSLKQKREHLDWHVARRLQSLHDAEESRVRFAKSRVGGSKKMRGRQRDLKSFFHK